MNSLDTTQIGFLPSPLQGATSPLNLKENGPGAERIEKGSTDKQSFVSGTAEISDTEVWQSMIGREVGREAFVDGQIRARQLLEQSEEVSDRLESCGLQGRSTRDGVSIVGLVSGQVEAATDFRNCNLIPVQQSKNVHDMLKHVRYLVDTTHKKNCLRMLVVSGGWCRFDQYRKNHKAHTRRMSKFAAHKKLKEFGIKIQFYNVENTIHRDNDTAMLNMHSHVLFRSTRFLGKKKWAEFLEFARNHFPKGYVHDSKIENPKEVVKYVFKPSEFELMTDEEFTEFAYQVIGGRCQFDPETGEILTRLNDKGELVDIKEGPLKFFHPLGSMRKFRSELRADRQKLIMVPVSGNKWDWRKTEKKKPLPTTDKESDGKPKVNIVHATTRPMPKFTPRMEPCLIVEGYCGDFNKMIAKNGLFGRVKEAREIFTERARLDAIVAREAKNESQGAAPSMKHTTTTTVHEKNSLEGVSYQYPPPDQSETPPNRRLH